ncbi:MAG: type II toxin-antitoxin system PemK/MazF family toxin [Alphaproteobacteria bacterium]|nr:type II toxin-antitoxin system PemK/MazF family toxin [Alphaproteobacteria bacterium]
MPISYPVPQGSLVTCDFGDCFVIPEMTKRRLVVVLNPIIATRPGLCTVVALSATAPDPQMPYHCQINITPQLPPKKFQSNGIWVKGDMIYTVGFHRLDLIRTGRIINGEREYYLHQLQKDQLKQVYKCVLHGMGLSSLTPHI